VPCRGIVGTRSRPGRVGAHFPIHPAAVAMPLILAWTCPEYKTADLAHALAGDPIRLIGSAGPRLVILSDQSSYREVLMDDLNDPRISAYKPQRRLRVPRPPGPRPKRSKAQRDKRKRADAQAERLHLVGLTGAAVIVMGVILAAVVVLLVLLLMGYR
jgi:hypothetical protein